MKESLLLHLEARKLRDLEDIRADGGPFVFVEEIDEYLQSDVEVSVKQRHMRQEVRYAWDTCVTLPKSHAISKCLTLQLGLGSCFALKSLVKILVLLGKHEGQVNITLQEFRNAIDQYNVVNKITTPMLIMTSFA